MGRYCGLDQEDAEAEIQADGFTVGEVERPPDPTPTASEQPTPPQYVVVDQVPRPNAQRERGTPIDLVLGPPDEVDC